MLDRRTQKAGHRLAKLTIAAITYADYVISSYLLLYLSRVREYWADRFSITHTRQPNSLINALVKIGFGLMTQANEKEAEPHPNLSVQQLAMGFQTMNIVGVANSKELALACQEDSADDNHLDTIKKTMRWDLWSPWATYYELNSTHPLIAKRIQAIATYGLHLGLEPDIVFDLEKPESYWDDFGVDLLVLTLPLIMAIAGLILTAGLIFQAGPFQSCVLTPSH